VTVEPSACQGNRSVASSHAIIRAAIDLDSKIRTTGIQNKIEKEQK